MRSSHTTNKLITDTKILTYVQIQGIQQAWKPRGAIASDLKTPTHPQLQGDAVASNKNTGTSSHCGCTRAAIQKTSDNNPLQVNFKTGKIWNGNSSNEKWHASTA